MVQEVLQLQFTIIYRLPPTTKESFACRTLALVKFTTCRLGIHCRRGNKRLHIIVIELGTLVVVVVVVLALGDWCREEVRIVFLRLNSLPTFPAITN